MYEELIKKAAQARENAYAEYSGFKVGAALLCSDGEIYTGCNIENKSFSLTNCAERTAIFKAVCDGKKDFTAIAVIGAVKSENCMENQCFPCGACLQVISEFCSGDFKIILSDKCKIKIYSFSDFMPNVFSSEF